MKTPFTEFSLQGHPLEAQNFLSCFPLKINFSFFFVEVKRKKKKKTKPAGKENDLQ